MHRGVVYSLAAVVALTTTQPLRAEITADQVREAIERGVDYLSRQQGAGGRWDDSNTFPGGVTALCTLALLNCGVSADDPRIGSALTYLRTLPPSRTYSVALQTMVFCAALPEQHLALIERNVRWLEGQQVLDGPVKGGWSYPGGMPDHSNSQFALLALWEAERVGVQADDRTWRLALDEWLGTQSGDGGWGYSGIMPSTGSMTCAGLGSLVIAAQRLHEPDARVVDGRLVCCARQLPNSAVEKGLQWLGRNFSVQSNPRRNGYVLYYLYALERVGRLTARRFIGGHDWYREGCEHLVRMQDDLSGLWIGAGGEEANPQIGTSFALLFLSKGRRPVVVAKLHHGTSGDWNNHRQDIANLTAYTETRWKRDLTWQIVEQRAATADDLLESPVVFFNGREAPQFTDEQVKTLREYVDRGGFLFAEACCDGDAFDRGFRELMRRVFPEPEYELRPLPPEHPVWRAEQPIDPDLAPELWGIDIGCRTSVIYCPEDLSCYWELARPGRERELPGKFRPAVLSAEAVGINVLAYATNREIKYKLEALPDQAPVTKPEAYRRATLQIAKLRHGGSWDAAPGALVALKNALVRELGMRVDTDRHELTISDPALMEFPLVFMHGRNDFHLSQAERNHLRDYLSRGGTALVDAVCGSEAFARAVRREVAEMFPDQLLERIPIDDKLFSTQFNGFEIRQVTRRDPQRGGDKLEVQLRQVEPDLEGLKVGGRWVLIFSPYDLSCALERHESLECRGYTREDAARLAINVVLYALH